MAVPAQQLTTFETVITDIATELYEAFAANESGVVNVNSTIDTLQRYKQRVDSVAEIAESANLRGLQELCKRFSAALESLSDQGRILSNQEMEQLEQWPTVAMVYIASPIEENAKALVELLQHVSWAPSLTEEDANRLQRNCVDGDGESPEIHSYICDHEVDVEPHNEISFAFDSHLLDTLQQEVLDALGILFNELDIQVENPDAKIETTVEALELCADRIKLLGMSAATAGIFGLMDVCQLFQDCLRKLAQLHRIVSLEERNKLEEWRGVVIAYLDNPNDVNTIDALANYFNDIPWVSDISEEETILLKDLLLPEEIELEEDTNTDNCELPSNQPEVETIEVQDDTQAEPQIDEYEISESYEQNHERATHEEINLNAGQMQDEQVEQDFSLQTISDESSVEKHSEQEILSVSVDVHEQLAEETEIDIELVSEQPQEIVAEHEESTQTDADENFDPLENIDTLQEDHDSLQVDTIEPTAEPVSEQQNELIQLVKGEIEANSATLSELLETVASQESGIDLRLAELSRYNEIIGRFNIAAESVGLHGLHKVLNQIQSNIQHYIENSELFSTDSIGLLSLWPELAIIYLDNIQDQQSSQQFGEYLLNDFWPVACSEQDVSNLIEELGSPQFPDLEEDVEQRPSQACPEDVSLALPEDVNQQLLDSLLQELPGHTAEFSAAITNIVDGNATLQDVDVAKRVAHTLKGSANTVGVAGIANISHHIEDILIAFSKHEKLPGSQLADILMQAADVIEMMSEALVGMGPEPDHAQNVLQAVLDCANRIDQEGIPDEEESSNPAVAQNVAESTGIEQSTGQEAAATPMLRVPASLVDELLRLVGESIILTGQLQEQLNQAQSQTQSVRGQNALFQQLAFELEQLVDVQGIASALGQSEIEEQFDSLELDQYNELHTVTRRLVEAATDAREITQGVEDHLTAIDNLLVDQGRIQKQNQEVVMQTRMVPVQSIVPRLQRSVRQTCRTTGKKAELHVEGSDTMIDSDVLNALVDPLMHVLRNAVDHGIENPDARTSHDKAEVGSIELRFYREGDHIVVRCSDDGAGLDFETIKQTAISKGIIEAEQEISQEELTRYILIPGFSTRYETTQVSGRGIGMDAVYSQVLRLKGGLNIDSQPGKGCIMELRLPLTLISIHTLLVQSKHQTLAISTRGIEQILYASAGELEHSDGKLIFRLGEENLEVSYLETLLNLPVDEQLYTHPNQPVLIVREESGDIRAILVEQVRASQDLVVKQLGRYAPKIEGIEGATILGDGSVAPVIDLPSILRSKSNDFIDLRNESTELLNKATQKTCALVVDDSLSARRSLAEFLQDTGYEVLTARDGLDAIDVIAQKKPDILLVDLEMPRMNGLELTSHVRTNSDLKDLPIIMVTSRSTEKHRQQAKRLGVDVYLTKPYIEDELLTFVEEQLVPSTSDVGMKVVNDSVDLNN